MSDLKRWLTDHQLMRNESKTEEIAINVPSCKVPPAITDINICGCNITLQQTVRDIGVDACQWFALIYPPDTFINV